MALKFSTTGTSQTIRLAATGTPPAVNLEYSLDGVNYQAWNKSAITFGNGVSVYIRGYDNIRFAIDQKNYHNFVFGTSSKVTCEGDVADLLEYRTPVTEYTEEGTFIYLFTACTALLNTPEMSVKKIVKACYRNMYSGCTSLTTVAELPAKKVGHVSYSNMFNGCTALVNPPALPATELNESSYSYMFRGCTNLRGDIVLLPKALTTTCYYGMFMSCSKINNITIYAETGINATNLTNWLSGVASSGTIYIIKGTRSQYSTGVSGIPSGWSVVEFEPVYDYIEVSEDELDFTYAGGSSSVVVSSTNSWTATVDSNWISVDTMTGEAGDTTVNITCGKYGGSEDRIGTITFAMENDMDCTVTITQTRMGLVIPTGKIIRGILRIN